jgi:CotH kinase protein
VSLTLRKSSLRRSAFATALLAALAALVCAASAAAAIEDEAAVVYDPYAVSTVDLTLNSEAIEKLELEPGEYVDGTFEMATTSGGPGGEETTLTPTPLAVKVRLKGSGSFRPITEKAAFKLKFGKTEPFLGLRKMTLNNMVQDDSMAHEALTYLTFGALGSPASRSGYVYLRINGEDVGLYADIENLDDIGLEKRFGEFDDPQHLYEGESGVDVLPGEAEKYEVDEGDDEEFGDLEALIAAVNGSEPASFSDRVAAVADLDEMARMWAIEHYVDHWDGYSGHVEPGLRPNNYYLYSDAAGRFQMLPWGTDQTWDLNLEIPHRIIDFDSEGGLLFNECLADEACFRLYWEALGEVTDTVEAMEADAFLAATAAMLAPWQEKEREDGRAEQDEGQVGAAVNEMATFIANRPEEARAWLAAHEPPPLPEESPADSTGPQAVVPPRVVPAGPSRRPVRLGRIARQKRVITLRLGFAGAGTVRMRGTTTLRGHRVNACATNVDVSGRGREALACKLSPNALKRLARSAAWLRLRVVFTSTTGTRTVAKRTIRLPKTR